MPYLIGVLLLAGDFLDMGAGICRFLRWDLVLEVEIDEGGGHVWSEYPSEVAAQG